MKAHICEREHELLDALGRGYIGEELTAHIGACAACSELRLVAGALLDERWAAATEARVPSAGTMWFRMQLRARHEAQAKARGSLLIGQAVTLVVALCLVAIFFGAQIAGETRHLIATIKLSTPLVFALVTWVLAAPVAGWVAIRSK